MIEDLAEQIGIDGAHITVVCVDNDDFLEQVLIATNRTTYGHWITSRALTYS